MQTFTFMKHTLEVQYPESSAKVKFGRGYTFVSKPRGADQILFILHFKAMWFWFTNPTTYDKTKNPTINMAVLEDFYNAHKLYEPFIYPHQTLGNVTVRFDQPLKYKLVEGGNGQVEPFQLTLITQP